MSDRATLAQDFLNSTGWGTARRAFLAGDASDRSYDRLWRGPDTAVLMDAPPGKGDDPAQFVAIAGHLAGLGLSAPRIMAQDLTQGFLLIEDLGDALFARIMAKDPARETGLLLAATDVLVTLQSHPAPPGLPDQSAADWADAAGFAPRHYAAAITGAVPDTAGFTQAMTAAMHDPAFFQRDHASVAAHNAELAATQTALEQAYAQWETLDG